MAHEHHHTHEHRHAHAHHHDHEGGSQKRQAAVVGAAAVLLAAAVAVEHSCSLTLWQLLAVYMVPYLLVGAGTLREAAEGLLHGEPLNEHFLMSVATLGALAIGFLPGAEPQLAEAVAVMLLFQVGELFEGYAERRSRRSIARLMDIRPDVARVEGTGVVEAASVAVGTTIIVQPGERVPIDGIITEGTTQLNTVALTGESLPREAAVGSEVASGCINLQGLIRVRTTKSFGESTASKIIALVESAGEKKSRSEAYITRFARVYTPVVVAAAVLLAVVPPVVAGGAWSTWIYRALMFLVVSCPCALVISVPLTFFGGIGSASRRGILVKGGSYMDALARIDTVVLDKTGTLTEGRFAVGVVHPEMISEQQLLHMAAHVEHYSTHPIGAALREAFPEAADDGCHVSDVEEVAGQGIRARINNKVVCVGNTRLMDSIGAQWHDCGHTGTTIHVAIDGAYAGHIVIADRVKADSREAVAALRRMGVSRTLMLTGDRREVAADVARATGLTDYAAELLPADKVARVEQLMSERTATGRGCLAFVGDGINDAPVLARADVGVAMGALGSDAAIEAADVVLMDDRLSLLPVAIALARRTIGIARQNIALAIGVKAAVLALAAVGAATMWMAVFADVGVMVLAVLNAMRTLRLTR